MPEPVFSRILLKLSGEVLANKHGFGIDPEKVLYLAREIEPVYKVIKFEEIVDNLELIGTRKSIGRIVAEI